MEVKVEFIPPYLTAFSISVKGFALLYPIFGHIYQTGMMNPPKNQMISLCGIFLFAQFFVATNKSSKHNHCFWFSYDVTEFFLNVNKLPEVEEYTQQDIFLPFLMPQLLRTLLKKIMVCAMSTTCYYQHTFKMQTFYPSSPLFEIKR